ncbi:MAG: 4-alpha-glucanotransferase [Gammaproteobacteria bacterium]|nr:4-alpha-glucanotransferase [Gammaproteobacteria bacterium]
MEADLKPSVPGTPGMLDVPPLQEAPVLSIVRDPEPAPGAEIPRATYRVQLSKSFTFKDVTEIVPYLASLGISHVYCSPYFKARAGSVHGYDVVDHNQLNPEIGDRADFENFVAALRSHHMGHILDIVPNHVGIMGADNAWWMDVLENGQASKYADYFDIEWNPANPALKGKVLVPVLGDPYGVVLDKGELVLRFERELGSFAVFYHEHRLPIDPQTYPLIIDRVLATTYSGELENLRRGFVSLADRHDPTDEQIAQRDEAKENLKRRLIVLCSQEPPVGEALGNVVQSFAGTPGDSATFDALHELLEVQPYRLASWRVAPDEINYRRFFDVNDLAGLRVENLTVFENTHRLLFELIGAGRIDGLRVDHPDGLRDPEQYFHRLQGRVAALRGTAQSSAASPGAVPASDVTDPPDFGVAGQKRNLPIYLVAEKITASFEHIPQTWPVHGETGYHFANVVNRLLVDAATKARMDRVYHAFIEQSLEWSNVTYDAQHMILRRSLASELSVVANQLTRIAQADRHTRDLTYNILRQTLAEVIACFPVYRTYVGNTASDTDKRYIDWAIASARRRRTAGEAPAFDFVRSALLMELPVATESLRRQLRNFAMKFQQVTAPITAKGIEDTSLYRFNRLTSLNEVGGEPDAYGSTVRAFHADSQHRARFWPHEMLGTSTHDTKRSEDVRARINVLSEMTQVWRKTIERWTRINRLRKREVEGQPAPSLNDEYLLYQTLVGSWPLEELDEAGLTAYRERIEGYMIKAAREAKSRTSWANVNAEYEEALLQFIRVLLEQRDVNLFLTDFIAFQRRISRFGLLNAMSQTLCKLTAPGVPDIYQGNEVWDFSLVDPDNRRPVDYPKRRRMLAELESIDMDSCVDRGLIESLVTGIRDGRCKLFLTWKVLQFRRDHESLFRDGEYLPLRVSGEYAPNVCAFARRHEGKLAVTIAPRLYLRLLGPEREEPPLGESAWGDTVIELPKEYGESVQLKNLLDGRTVATAKAGSRVTVTLADALLSFPVALLTLPS